MLLTSFSYTCRKEGFRTRWIQKRRNSREKECRTGGIRYRIRRDAEKVGCRTVAIQVRWDAVKEGCSLAGQVGCRKVVMQLMRDVGKEGCSKEGCSKE